MLLSEEDIVGDPVGGLGKAYEFLGLDAGYRPEPPGRRVHGSRSWTRCVVNYHAGPLRRWLAHGRAGGSLDPNPLLNRLALPPSDIEFLQGIYRPDHAAPEDLVGRSLACRDCGAGLLERRRRH